MRPFKFFYVIMLGLGISLTGCAANTKVLPQHDEVLQFDLPYDLTYLRAMEAVERVEGWELQATEKEKGLLIVRNINYSSLDDADQRTATFVVKRVAARKTSVELAPYSQRVIGGDDLLERISQYLNREVDR